MLKKYCCVCDGEVNGLGFCKNCKSFVETYESSRTYYVNERHGESKLPHDCDYHDTDRFPKYRDPQPNRSERPQPQPNVPTQRRIERTSSPQWDEMQRQRQTKNKKTGTAKITKIFLVIWFVIFFGSFASVLIPFFGMMNQKDEWEDLQESLFDDMWKESMENNLWTEEVETDEPDVSATLPAGMERCNTWDHFEDVYLKDIQVDLIQAAHLQGYSYESMDTWEKSYENWDEVEEVTLYTRNLVESYTYEDNQVIEVAADSVSGELHYVMLQWKDMKELSALCAIATEALDPTLFEDTTQSEFAAEYLSVLQSMTEDSAYFSVGTYIYFCIYELEDENGETYYEVYFEYWLQAEE